MTVGDIKRLMDELKDRLNLTAVTITEFRNQKRVAKKDELKGNPMVVLRRNQRSLKVIFEDEDFDEPLVKVAARIVESVNDSEF